MVAPKDPERTGFGYRDVITAKATTEENRADTYSGVVQVLKELAMTVENAAVLSDVAPVDDVGAGQCNNQPVGVLTNHGQYTYPVRHLGKDEEEKDDSILLLLIL